MNLRSLGALVSGALAIGLLLYTFLGGILMPFLPGFAKLAEQVSVLTGTSLPRNPWIFVLVNTPIFMMVTLVPALVAVLFTYSERRRRARETDRYREQEAWGEQALQRWLDHVFAILDGKRAPDSAVGAAEQIRHSLPEMGQQWLERSLSRAGLISEGAGRSFVGSPHPRLWVRWIVAFLVVAAVFEFVFGVIAALFVAWLVELPTPLGPFELTGAIPFVLIGFNTIIAVVCLTLAQGLRWLDRSDYRTWTGRDGQRQERLERLSSALVTGLERRVALWGRDESLAGWPLLGGVVVATLEQTEVSKRRALLARIYEMGLLRTNRAIDFRNADLGQTSFEKVNWPGIDLQGARLHGVSFEGARLDDARLDETDLHGARLQNASFQDASLRNARLMGTLCHRSTFRRADFEGADLSEANLWQVDLSDARIDKAQIGVAKNWEGSP